VNARLNFKERSPAELQSHQYIKPGLICEIAEIDVSICPFEVLMGKIEARSSAHICRPSRPSRRYRQPVDGLKINGDHRCQFSEGEFDVGPKPYIIIKKRP